MRFFDRVEKEARELIDRTKEGQNSFSITKVFEQKIAGILEQIDRQRNLMKRQQRSLVRGECRTDTAIMGMLKNQAPYIARLPDESARKDKLDQRLLMIEGERRKHSVFYESTLLGLQEKLLSLMQQHEQVSFRGGPGGLEEAIE